MMICLRIICWFYIILTLNMSVKHSSEWSMSCEANKVFLSFFLFFFLSFVCISVYKTGGKNIALLTMVVAKNSVQPYIAKLWWSRYDICIFGITGSELVCIQFYIHIKKELLFSTNRTLLVFIPECTSVYGLFRTICFHMYYLVHVLNLSYTIFYIAFL